MDIGIVPLDFCLGITTPIPKYKGCLKNVSTENFRGITLNPTVSKIFEHCLLPFFESISTSERQFGFKKGVGCLNVIHVVRKVVNYFNKSGNTVNLSVIDVKKAFDNTSVYGVLNLLKSKGVNHSVLKVLSFWFSNTSTKVQWGDRLSEQVPLTSGVRQGGILSPFLFAYYVNSVLVNLEKPGLGCFVSNVCYKVLDTPMI